MKKIVLMLVAILGVGLASLQASASCPPQDTGPFVYTQEEHK